MKQNNIKLSLNQSKGGQSLNIIAKPEEEKITQVISVKSMRDIQTKYNLSTNVTLGIASDIRVATKKRTIIELGLKESLIENVHRLDSFFYVEKISVNTEKKKVKTISLQPVVYCKDLDGLVSYIKKARNIADVYYKIGIDGGGGFLKICLSIQSSMHTANNDNIIIKRRKFKDGIGQNSFKETGVKKLFILALASNTQENYSNVLELWSLLNINSYSYMYTLSLDLKLANIMVGIMSHSSSHPCTWCNARKGFLEQQGVDRTIGTIRSNYKAWRDAGSNLKTAKNFNNCIHEPIFAANEKTKILDIITPPELHLMIGTVNTIVNKMEEEFESDTKAWIKKLCIHREVIHEGAGFNGNSCKTILDNINHLRSSSNLGIVKYVDVLHKFSKVVKSCFSKELTPEFKSSIEEFKNSYLSLDINVTPKVHAVFFHVVDFCSQNNIGLGFHSEQAFETVHYDFKQTWSRYKVSQEKNTYEKYLLKAICDYNSKHI